MNKFLSILLVVAVLVVCVPGWCVDGDIVTFLDNDTECWRIDSSGNMTHGTGYYGFMVPFTFTSDDIAANLSATAMPITVDAGSTEFIHYYTAPFAGSVMAISIYSDDAITTRWLTADVTINGIKTGLTTYLEAGGSYTTYNSNTQAVGTDAVAANDLIGVQIDTDASFAPTTSDIVIVIYLAQ